MSKDSNVSVLFTHKEQSYLHKLIKKTVRQKHGTCDLLEKTWTHMKRSEMLSDKKSYVFFFLRRPWQRVPPSELDE